MSNLTPTPGNILIKPQEESTKAISVVGDSQDMYEIGTVLKVGGVFLNKYNVEQYPACKEGDKIRYAYGKIEDIHEDGEVLRIIPFGAVLAIYEGSSS